MRGHVVALSSLALALPFLAAADTLPVNQIVAFGDSLTDTGNASIYATEHNLSAIPGSGFAYRTLDVNGVPTQVGEYTTGTSGLWIDQFATDAHLPDPQPFLAGTGGTNYAVAGASTGQDPDKSLGGFVTDQLNVYLGSKTTVPSTNLYSFWAGANDIINALEGGQNPIAAANAAASNLEANIATLAGDGGKYFLWFNLPELGNTPRGQSFGSVPAAALNAASLQFDADWMVDRDHLDAVYPDIVLVGVNIEKLFNQVAGKPGIFTFDGLHPTSYADSFIADLALTDFEAAIKPTTPPSTVPEPASAALLLFGAGMIAAAKLKAKNRG